MKLSIQRILKLLIMMVMAIAITIGCSNNLSKQTNSKSASLSTQEYRLVKDAIAPKSKFQLILKG